MMATLGCSEPARRDDCNAHRPGLAGGLAAGNAFSQRPLWAVLAVVFPALATTLAGYDALYAFQHQAQLFQDAARSLDLACTAASKGTDRG